MIESHWPLSNNIKTCDIRGEQLQVRKGAKRDMSVFRDRIICLVRVATRNLRSKKRKKVRKVVRAEIMVSSVLVRRFLVHLMQSVECRTVLPTLVS